MPSTNVVHAYNSPEDSGPSSSKTMQLTFGLPLLVIRLVLGPAVLNSYFNQHIDPCSATNVV